MIQKGNFKAHLELHSVDPWGCEAITFTHTHERSATHAEFMTHRVSRNASSSRAIPFERMIAWIDRDPAMPLYLGLNKKGMQSGKAIDTIAEGLCRRALRANYFVQRAFACMLHNRFGLHKEICNRYVEDYGWINVVSTWSREAFMNYIALRCTPHAEPRIQRLAINMLREYDASTPQQLNTGDWHMPFVVDKIDGVPNTQRLGDARIKELLVWSVARSAWVSYQTVDERDATWADAVKRHDDCTILKHATPCEHQAECIGTQGSHAGRRGNLPGFKQYRHMIPGETTTNVDIKAILKLYEGRDFITAA